MPRLRMTPQQRREQAITVAIANYRAENRIHNDTELAQQIGLTLSQWFTRKKSNFQNMTVDELGRMSRKYGFSPQVVCDILGVPFEQGKV